MYYGNTSSDKLTKPYRKYYSADGSMEVKATFANGDTTNPIAVEFMNYIGGDAYTAPIVLKSDGTTQNYFYLHRDYQGSILAVTNASGTIVEKRLFDAWGEIVKVTDGAGNALTQLTFFDRGYTGHEHLQGVGLINMNARLYDPKLHRFLSPDNYIQDPSNTQNYNRYGYCVNNPTKYTDITGNFFNSFAEMVSVIPVVGSIFASLLMHQSIDWGRVAIDAVVTGISIAVTCGIGTAVEGIKSFYMKAAVSALAHGVFQGGMTAIQGGKFWAGFASGALSSIAASLWRGGEHFIDNGNFTMSRTMIKGIGGNFAGSVVGTLAFSAVMGGAGAALAKGNFWQGATTGMIVAGFNHLMNHVAKKIKVNNNANKYLSDAGYEPGQDISSIPEDQRQAYIIEMIGKLPPSKLLYADGAEYPIDYSPTLKDNAQTNTNIEGTSTVFGFKSFSTNKELFLTIMHEGLHRWDISQGLMKNWGISSKAITETRAYEMQRWFNGGILQGIDARKYNFYSKQAYSSGFGNFSIRSYPIFFNNIQR